MSTGDRSLKPGWSRVAFGDVVRLNTDRASDPEAAGFSRYVGLEHIDPGDLTIRRWGDVADGTTFTNIFRPGQVLFGKRRAYQRKVAVPDFSGVCSSDIYESKDDRHLLPELLPFVCQTDAFIKHAVGTSAGSLSPRTNWQSLATYEFVLPPLDEQRRIAAALTNASDLKAAVHTLCQARHQVVASAAASEFANIEGIFTTVRLDSICSQHPQSGLYKPAIFHGRGSRVLTMKELFSNDVIHDLIDMEHMEVSEKELQNFKLTSNDILFGRRSVVLEGAGRCVLVSDRLQEPTVFESSVLRITLDPSRADPRYIFEWLRSPPGDQHLKRIVTFTTVSGVAGSDVARLRIPLPPLEVQRTIGRRLSRIRNGRNIFHDYSACCERLPALLLSHVMFDV